MRSFSSQAVAQHEGKWKIRQWKHVTKLSKVFAHHFQSPFKTSAVAHCPFSNLDGWSRHIFKKLYSLTLRIHVTCIFYVYIKVDKCITLIFRFIHCMVQFCVAWQLKLWLKLKMKTWHASACPVISESRCVWHLQLSENQNPIGCHAVSVVVLYICP